MNLYFIELYLAPESFKSVFCILHAKPNTCHLATGMIYLILLSVIFITDASTSEPCHEKTCLWGLQPDKIQTSLLSSI